MAYNQGAYQQPPQRPYNGRAAQPSAPAQQYNNYPPQQQYDQYAQDGYAYDQGYGADGYAPAPYHESVSNPGGLRNPQWAQNGNQPLQQEYHGGRSQRSGPGVSPRPSPRDDFASRGAGGGGGRPPPNGAPPKRGGPMSAGRGGVRPLDRNQFSDPGVRKPRIVEPSPKSPQTTAWDNPFPVFPGTKKKTSLSEEKKIIEKMEFMEIGSPEPRSAKSPPGRRSEEQSRRGPMGDGPRQLAAPSNGRPSIDSQRMPASRAHPQPPPPPKHGYGAAPAPPRRSEDNYRQPQSGGGYLGGDRGAMSASTSPMRNDNYSRSMTMPNENAAIPHSAANFGSSAPYNGPVGRVPPRPSTAGGNRPPPQRFYPNQNGPPQQAGYAAPAPPRQPQGMPYNENYDAHESTNSISEFYDHYLYERDHQLPKVHRSNSNGAEMPNFNAVPDPLQRSQAMDHPNRPPNGHQLKIQGGGSHPGMRAMAQAQSAEVFDMSNELSVMPDQYQQQGYPPDPYGQYDNQMLVSPSRGPTGPLPYPPRTTSGAQRPSPGPMNGTAPMPGQRFIHGDLLPAHPTPVRPGLLPNFVPNNAPVPVRQYGANVPLSPSQPAPAMDGELELAPVTHEEIGRMKEMVKNNPNGNLDGQLLLVRKLVEASEVLVAKLPDQRQRTKAREKYIFDATKILKKLVAAQHGEAMFYLADCYGRGALGLATDHKEAFSLYQGAAKQGHAGAAYRTAVCCELGNEEGGGTRKDPLKAIQWYTRAAQLGDTPAMYKMGMILLKGLLGQPKDPHEAVGWLKRAAECADAENPHALHELGLLYENAQPGDAMVRDEAYSLSLFTQAANLGYKFSQFRLGCAYEYGLLGLSISPRDSIMWYSRAAVQEEHQSELALSGWYLTGSEGVLQQSDTEAYLWARKAAMAKLAKAEYAMGYFTEVGIGAASNLEDAKRWYWRAAGKLGADERARTTAQGFPKARERLEDLKRGGSRPALRSRERISRSKVGKQNEGECAVM